MALNHLSRHWLALLLGAAVLVPAPARSAKGPRPIQVFLIPYDNDSMAMATKTGGLVERALKKQKGLRTVDLGDYLSGKAPPSVDEARRKAESKLQEGIARLRSIDYDQAVQSLNAALEIYREQAAWMDEVPEYGQALAYLGATYLQKGDYTQGRAALKELLLHDKSFTVDTAKFDASLQTTVEQVREEIQSGPRGSISVYSTPLGARVFIDGVHKGFTPASIDRIPTGRHLLRIEQLGTMPYGEVINVTPTEDTVIKAKLTPTDEFRKLQIVVTEVGKEIERGKVGPAMIKLGQYVGLEWAVYGVVRHSFGEVEIDAWVVSIPGQQRLANRRVSFSDSEFGLDKNVEEAVTNLLQDARRRAEKGSISDDPLSGHSGTEAWWDETKKDKRERTLDVSETDISSTGRGSDDPLDGMSGTEDW